MMVRDFAVGGGGNLLERFPWGGMTGRPRDNGDDGWGGTYLSWPSSCAVRGGGRVGGGRRRRGWGWGVVSLKLEDLEVVEASNCFMRRGVFEFYCEG